MPLNHFLHLLFLEAGGCLFLTPLPALPTSPTASLLFGRQPNEAPPSPGKAQLSPSGGKEGTSPLPPHKLEVEDAGVPPPASCRPLRWAYAHTSFPLHTSAHLTCRRRWRQEAHLPTRRGRPGSLCLACGRQGSSFLLFSSSATLPLLLTCLTLSHKEEHSGGLSTLCTSREAHHTPFLLFVLSNLRTFRSGSRSIPLTCWGSLHSALLLCLHGTASPGFPPLITLISLPASCAWRCL